MSFWLNDLDTEQLLIAAGLLAASLSQGLKANEVALLGNFLAATGDLMSIISAKQEQLENNNSNNNKKA